MKTLRWLFALALVAGCGWFAFRYLSPTPEQRIRKQLNSLAETVSIPAKVTPVKMMMLATRLPDYFTRDVQVEVQVPGEGRHTFGSREELMQVVQGAWSRNNNVKVEFLDINVKPQGETATAELTAKVSPGSGELWVQQLLFQLSHTNKEWRVARIEFVRTLR